MRDDQAPGAAPPKTRLGRILQEHPEARKRLGRAVGGLLTAVLATLAAVVVLSMWHLRRRADLIRSRLGEARGGPLPEITELPDPRPKPEKDGLA